MPELNETPTSSRLHIGFFGKRNSGKSSLINAFTNQEVSIVSDVAGTTTDLVYKAMEIAPLGPCTIIDTAGFDDEGALGQQRIAKTKLASQKVDIAVMVCYEADLKQELAWYEEFKAHKIPVLFVISKSDCNPHQEAIRQVLQSRQIESIIALSALTKEGLHKLKESITSLLPQEYKQPTILGDLVQEGDVVMLVMPQDKQAPKGRLILPQVQTIRELLDRQCIIISTTTNKYEDALHTCVAPPKLIIADSQVFQAVYAHKPKESLLTSFSVLFAAQKGDIDYYVEGAMAIASLTSNSKVLIAECCTHAPLEEDIGRVKIPAMLRKKYGETLQVDVLSGTDFPNDLSNYDLIIQCGACMFNRTYVLSRCETAKQQKVPMTNYGITIAYLNGILDFVAIPHH